MPPGWSGHGNIDSNEPRNKFQDIKKNAPTTEKEKKMKGRSLKRKERRERRINQSIVWTLSAISSTPPPPPSLLEITPITRSNQ
jgi:hypothetical protein